MSIHRVFDTGINKLFGSFDNEADTVRLAGALIGANHDDWATDLNVGAELPDGTFLDPLTGDELLARIVEADTLQDVAVAGCAGRPRT